MTDRARWHRAGVFTRGPRVALDRETRAVWRARLDLARRAGRLTPAHQLVGEALIRRLGMDGRCDPQHATLARDAGVSVSTVQRALGRLTALGLITWTRRLLRAGWRAAQTSNAYVLAVPDGASVAEIRRPRCVGQAARGISLVRVIERPVEAQMAALGVGQGDVVAARRALQEVRERRAAALWGR